MSDTVYLLHFDDKIGDIANPRGAAQHYLGYTSNLDSRLDQHARGRSGAGIVRAFYEAGISFIVARTWTGDRSLERRLKNQKNSPRLCPICKEACNG